VAHLLKRSHIITNTTIYGCTYQSKHLIFFVKMYISKIFINDLLAEHQKWTQKLIAPVIHSLQPSSYIKPIAGCYPACNVQKKNKKKWYMKLCALQVIHLPSCFSETVLSGAFLHFQVGTALGKVCNTIDQAYMFAAFHY